MKTRTSLYGGAALGAILALTVVSVAEAKTKHHHRVSADAGLRSEVSQLSAEVQELKAWRDNQMASEQQTQQQVQALQGQLADADARATRAEADVQSQIQTIPGVVQTEVARNKPKTDALYVKGIKITLGGFTALETVSRQRNMTSDIATNFSTIPYPDVPASHVGETRFSARQSRLSLLAQGDVTPTIHLSGYGEFDFLGDAQTGNSNQTNSYNPRIRNLYGAVDIDENGGGWHFLAGQNWSLVTTNSKGIMPRTEAPPPTIDAQYVVGFAFTRQPQVRVAYDWNKKFWLALSLENPQTTFASGSNLFSNIVLVNTSLPGNGNGGSLFFNTTNFSLNQVPDVVVKVAGDDSWAGHSVHAELFGLARQFVAREDVGGTAATSSSKGSAGVASNKTANGFGVGGGVIAQLAPKVLDLQFSGLYGNGVGRYATSSLPDIAFRPDGSIKPLTEWALMGGLTYHYGAKLDVYAFGGIENQDAQAFDEKQTPVSATTHGGLGNLAFTNNFGCMTESTATASAGSGSAINAIPGCNGQTHQLEEATVGFWDRAYSGSFGRFQWGLQYSYIHREGFASGGGSVGAPHTDESMLMSSFRYFPF